MRYGSFQGAYDQIKSSAKLFADNVPLILLRDFDLDGQDSMLTVLCEIEEIYQKTSLLQLPTGLTNFNSLRDFKVPDDAKVDWPKNHKQVRIDPEADLVPSSDEYEAHVRIVRDLGGTGGIDKVLTSTTST
ncbi:unnamed protein product [Clonostachys solani]|uniref:Uncharacterized protein n=1 Tax=Clonostachys solani TaxID=160281 RepID=A0A9N9YYZ4_9HYPO|nr:unnamed protein product [Clonostachys solani]